MNNKLNRMTLDQNIDNHNIQQIQGNVANIQARILGDKERFSVDKT